MDIDRPVNHLSRSLEKSPFLELPSELVKLVCSFLSLKQVKELRCVSKSLGRMVIEFKEKEEKLLVGKLSLAILKTGVFLTPSEREELEKLERSQEMKRTCASWEDIGDYEKAWTGRVIEILGTSPRVLVEKEAVKIEFAQFLHPYSPTPTGVSMQNTVIDNLNIGFFKITYNPQEERSFAPSCNLRVTTLLKTLTLYLLISKEERYGGAMNAALEGEYRGEEGNAVLDVLVQLQMHKRCPHREMLQMARKMNKEQKGKSYLLILDRALQESFNTFYGVVEEMLEEDLSGATQNQILQKLAKADISRGIEKALKLRDRPSVQKQAFIDIVTHFLPHALLAGEEVCKQMILLMENIGKEEEGNAFETVRLLQCIMSNHEFAESFWTAIAQRLHLYPLGVRREIAAIGSILIYNLMCKVDGVEVCKKGLQLLRPFERAEEASVMHLYAEFFAGAIVQSGRDESKIIESLSLLFSLRKPALVREVIDVLFREINRESLFFRESDIFYITLDKEIQAVEERQWIEEKIYEVGTNPNYELDTRFFGELIKRFCRKGPRKEEAILAMFRRHKELSNRDFGTVPFCDLPDVSFELIRQVKAVTRKNKLITDLQPQDLIAAIGKKSLFFHEVFACMQKESSDEEKERGFWALIVGQLLLCTKEKRQVKRFLDRYQGVLTEEMRGRILHRLFNGSLITEGWITPQQGIEWIKEERDRTFKEGASRALIDSLYWILLQKESSIGEVMRFIGEMEEGELRDKWFNEIARLLTGMHTELFPNGNHDKWILGIEAFLRVADQKAIQASIDYADNKRGFVEFLPKLIIAAQRIRKKEVLLLLLKRVVGFLGYKETFKTLISFLCTLGEEGDQESLMACTPYWSFLITSRVIEKGEALRMIRKIENEGEREKALLGVIKNHETLVRGCFFSRGEILALTEELRDQEARDCYAEEIRVLHNREDPEQGIPFQERGDFINQFLTFK